MHDVQVGGYAALDGFAIDAQDLLACIDVAPQAQSQFVLTCVCGWRRLFICAQLLTAVCLLLLYPVDMSLILPQQRAHDPSDGRPNA